jgi:Tfp pilus assembly protein PilF
VYKKDNGEEVNIHSSEDPANCAKQAIELLGKMGKEGLAVLFGFGLGYFAEEVFKNFEKGHLLMVYEATPELFKTALRTRDLSGLLESEKVKIILGADTENFSIVHSHYHLIVHGKFWIVKHHPSVKLDEATYERFEKRLREEKSQSDSGIGTAIALGKEFMNTFMENIPSIIRKHGVKELKDIFKGRPAIIVSAGPSLEKNFHLLRKAKGKAIIIAVDVVLPTLLPADIIPDILVAIDPLPENIAVFKDNPLLKEVPFICLAQYTPEIVDIYPGPIFMNSVPGNVIYQWLCGFWEEKGYVEAFGGSVAHLAFGAAEYIGSDVIAIIGQDMSFTDKYHAGDTTSLLHAYHDQEVPDYRKGAQVEDDIFGEKRYTSGGLLAFKVSFENKIRTFKGTVLQATEGGLPIEGANVIRLADFIDEYCNMPEIDSFSVLSGCNKTDLVYNLDGLLIQVKGARDIFLDIKSKSKKMLKYIHRIKKLKEKEKGNSPEFHNILAKTDALFEKIKHPVLNIIAAYHYQLELFLKRQDMQEIDEIEDKEERLERQLHRGLNYYGELLEAIELLVKQLDKLTKSLEREIKVNNIIMDNSLAEHEKALEVGMIYKKAGKASQAVKYLELVIKGDEMSIDVDTRQKILVSLAQMYIRQFRYYEAREVLKKVSTRTPKFAERAEKLLKTCDEKLSNWEDRKKYAERLLKKAAADYGSHIESGYFYFKTKDYLRAVDHYEKAIAEYESSDTLSETKESLVEAYYSLAHTYIATDEVEKAVAYLEKAIEEDPGNPLFYRDLGLIAFQNNNIEPAELFFSKAIELAPQEAELYKQLAGMYISIGEKEKAVALYENALQVNGDNPQIQQDLAMMYKDTIENTQGCEA